VHEVGFSLHDCTKMHDQQHIIKQNVTSFLFQNLDLMTGKNNSSSVCYSGLTFRNKS